MSNTFSFDEFPFATEYFDLTSQIIGFKLLNITRRGEEITLHINPKPDKISLAAFKLAGEKFEAILKTLAAAKINVMHENVDLHLKSPIKHYKIDFNTPAERARFMEEMKWLGLKEISHGSLGSLDYSSRNVFAFAASRRNPKALFLFCDSLINKFDKLQPELDKPSNKSPKPR